MLTGEAIIKFLLKEVSENDSLLSQNFCKHLVDRINSRRDPAFMSLVSYLNDRNALSEPTVLKMCSKTAVTKLGIEIASRLFKQGADTVSDEEDEEPVEQQSQPQTSTSTSMHSRLMQAVNRGKKVATPNPNADNLYNNSMRNAFTRYDQSGFKTIELENLYAALLTAPPTSTQSERNFSLAGAFVTKIRTRLGDKVVDPLSFLKSYFTKHPDTN